MSANEFARAITLDTIGEVPRVIAIQAEPAERAALAARFGLVALDRLEADLMIRRAGAIIHAEGRMRASLAQSCVATGDPVPAMFDQPFTLRFVPEDEMAAQEELELSEADCDVIGYEGGAIDLGEAVAETMALALDPFPRGADADAVLRAAGVRSEEEEATAAKNPFAALRGLLKE